MAAADCGGAATNVASGSDRGYLLTFGPDCVSHYGLGSDESSGRPATTAGEQQAPALAAPSAEDETKIVHCAQQAGVSGVGNAPIDHDALDKCLEQAGIDPDQVVLPGVAE